MGQNMIYFGECLCVLNAYSAIVGQSVLEILIRSNWLIVLFRQCSIFFFLLIISIAERRVLKYLVTVVGCSVTLLRSISFCFLHFETLLLGTYIFRVTTTS